MFHNTLLSESKSEFQNDAGKPNNFVEISEDNFSENEIELNHNHKLNNNKNLLENNGFRIELSYIPEKTYSYSWRFEYNITFYNIPGNYMYLYFYVDSLQKDYEYYYTNGKTQLNESDYIYIYGLDYGDHILTLQAKCDDQQSNNISYEFSFGYTNKLNLSNLNINSTELRKNIDQELTLSGIASYSKGNSTATIMYYFNKNDENPNSTNVEVDSNGPNFSISIKIPSDLPETTNTIYFYLEKNYSISRIYHISFNITRISIKIIVPPKEFYSYQSTEGLNVSFELYNIPVDSVEIYFYFDSLLKTTKQYETLNCSNYNDYASIDFHGLDYGDHILKLQAKGSNQYSDNVTSEFSYGFTDKLDLPSFDISQREITKDVDKDFTLSGRARYSIG